MRGLWSSLRSHTLYIHFVIPLPLETKSYSKVQREILYLAACRFRRINFKTRPTNYVLWIQVRICSYLHDHLCIQPVWFKCIRIYNIIFHWRLSLTVEIFSHELRPPQHYFHISPKISKLRRRVIDLWDEEEREEDENSEWMETRAERKQQGHI